VGNEAVELLAAMNLGKKVWTTIHGNSAYDALLRLEDLAQGSGLSERAIEERISRGIDVIAHFRKGSWRYLEELVVVDGIDSAGRYRLRTLYDARSQKRNRAAELVSLWDDTVDAPQLPGETPAGSETGDLEELRRLFTCTAEEATPWKR